ncbi:hypothetical protein PEC730217_29380 [Pectobacterium carotovorum subsp. carotovorum]|nr:hypothetical protein OA04_32640 [Pectobacterium versatile]PVY73942.1 hypothetical protein C7330_3192 [Pectobacterium versatile]RUR90933.1 hypothetical protein PB16LOC_02988 [Pectobacterium versatile]GBO49637.1 hypothetical protein MFFDBJGM_02654 [Pectobacterium versatile]GKW34158.1 hypothetical protein PEC730217_29380 [Pectobacterium carotovorum subsp. carotovorum]
MSHIFKVLDECYDSDYLFMRVDTKVSCVLTAVFLCYFITHPTALNRRSALTTGFLALIASLRYTFGVRDRYSDRQ